MPSNDHIMLFYNSYDELIKVDAAYINKGSKKGHRCIYAFINAYYSKRYWSRNNQNITVVCPYPDLVLNEPILLDKK
jgi:hypothetical protein